MKPPPSTSQRGRGTTGNLEPHPTRSCLACRRRADKSSLLRLTTVGDTVRVDPTAALPGRGAYLCHREGCLDAALDRGASRLLRALRQRAGVVEVDGSAIAAGWSSRWQRREGADHSQGAGVSE